MGQVVVMCKTAAGMATAGTDIHYQFVSIDMNLYIHSDITNVLHNC